MGLPNTFLARGVGFRRAKPVKDDEEESWGPSGAEEEGVLDSESSSLGLCDFALVSSSREEAEARVR